MCSADICLARACEPVARMWQLAFRRSDRGRGLDLRRPEPLFMSSGDLLPTAAMNLRAISKRAAILSFVLSSEFHDVRFVPCVDGPKLARAFFTFCSIGRCSHVFGLLARHTGRWP